MDNVNSDQVFPQFLTRSGTNFLSLECSLSLDSFVLKIKKLNSPSLTLYPSVSLVLSLSSSL